MSPAPRKPYGAYGTIGPAPGFTWDEVRCHDGTLPALWTARRRYVYQARYLNQLRVAVARRCAVPVDHVSIQCNSWYRTPDYNKLIGGVADSQHVEHRATDVQVHVVLRGGKRVQLEPAFVGKLAARWVPAFAGGGIGVYGPRRGNFTHLDHRATRARWQG